MKRHSYMVLIPFVCFGYLFLYTPIFVLIMYSFNQNPFTQTWHGFTLDWYRYLFDSSEIMQALTISLFIALCTTVLSLFFSICFVLTMHEIYKKKFIKLFYFILAIPEIIIAVALLHFSGFFAIPISINTIIVGHTLLGLAYVIPIIHNRFNEIDKRLIEAAYDLGATDFQVFTTVIFPLLTPSILASALLVFIISLDDFLISFFCSGGTVQTLPLYIFSMIRAGATPAINALSTILLLISIGGLILFSTLQKPRTGKLS